MINGNFDIINLAQHYANSAEKVFPSELPDELKKFTSNIIFNFTE